MLHYPKIPGSAAAPAGRCLAFEKYDGSNLHWCWDRDFGWHAFGTRRDEFNLTPAGIADYQRLHRQQRQAVEVFEQTLAGSVARIFREHARYRDIQTLKIFTEFFGENSFAGAHVDNEPKQLILFDVWAEGPGSAGPGMIGPEEFVKDFADVPSARVVYRGRLTGKFTSDVREGKYGVAEGVVCKGKSRAGHVWMVKIKTEAFRKRLQQTYPDRWQEYWE